MTTEIEGVRNNHRVEQLIASEPQHADARSKATSTDVRTIAIIVVGLSLIAGGITLVVLG